VSSGAHIGAAFALGFALGAAPGPVQLLLLTETAKRGFSGGLRVMIGANGTLFAVMVALAFGFSSLAPSEGVLRGLRLVGGAFLIYLAADELRRLRREATGDPTRPIEDAPGMGPTTRGIVSVILNPGAWIFFATTASAVIAEATADAGRDAALAAAVAMTVGCPVGLHVSLPCAAGPLATRSPMDPRRTFARPCGDRIGVRLAGRPRILV
jgi:threonine/homoserine/homoserine lactone efflux protein